MSGLRSALYVGRIGHVRLKPKRHALAYRSFMALIDLDELEALDRRLRWFSVRRFNLFGFCEQDHGSGAPTPLRVQTAAHLASAGVAARLGRIRLLCLPRMLGYVFNPISLYFCYDEEDELIAILYEVNSTFGERHTYLVPVTGPSRPIRQRAAKRLHVSPFMDMGLTYDFRVDPPGETVRVAVEVRDRDGVVLTASFAGRRKPVTDPVLLRTFFSHPLQTLAVVAAIHWEALKLLARGLRLRPGLPAPVEPVSLGEPL